MLRYILTAWIAITLSFFALRVIPGDAVESQLRQSGTSPQDIAAQREAFGLNDPLPLQYADYLGSLAQGDLGVSLVTRERVSDMIAARLLPTIHLAIASLGVAIAVGILIGTLAGFPVNPPLSWLSGGLITLALAMPTYWTATLAIYLTSHQFGWLPSGGTEGFASLILPALVLGFSIGGGIARVVETTLREILTQPFLQTAYAKGLGWWGIYVHALRASLPPILSIIALQAGFLLGGTVLVEIIFTRRGLGSLLHQAVLNQDYPVVQGLVLLGALVYALTRGIARWLSRRADPRLMEPLLEAAA
jgi:peptide/nickel transport system permease protein